MKRIPDIRPFFRLPSSEKTLVRDIDDEIAFHLQARARALEGAGMSPVEARRQAEREFGDVSSARAELASIDRVTVRRERRGEWWDALRHDVRLSLRGMRRSVAFSVAVILTLALGIGVNAAMFGIADRLLLSPPAHVRAADEVVRVMYRHIPEGPSLMRTGVPGEITVVSRLLYREYALLRDGVSGFQSAGAYATVSTSVLGRGAGSAEVEVMPATASLFTTLGVQPALGRFFSEAEDRPPHGQLVAVLSDALWHERFGGDASVLGRTLELGHEQYEIIGVAPRGFTGPELTGPDIWIPVSVVGPRSAGDQWHVDDSMRWLRMVARLDAGVSLDAARAQASTIFGNANAERFAKDTSFTVVLSSLIAARTPASDAALEQRSGRIALWLLGVSVLVLLIACANVANLLLARGMRRQREIGVRMAMGVGRLRIVQHVFTETLLFALFGTALGLLLAHWGGGFARALLLPDVQWTGSAVDGRVLGFAIAIAASSALLAGMLPALHAARADAASALALGGRTTRRRSHVRRTLIAVQAALSVLLLVGAGLFLRSLQAVSHVELGFEPDRVAMLRWHDEGLDWNTQRVQALYDAGLERVRALPDVEAAAISTTAPMWIQLFGYIQVPGLDTLPERVRTNTLYASVSTDYFRTVGARIVRGRAFSDTDVPGSPRVAIVTQDLADLLWPGEAPLGKCIVQRRDPEKNCASIVGIVEHTRYDDVLAEPTPMYYLPLKQEPGFGLRNILVRPRSHDRDAIHAIGEALQTLEPGLPHVSTQWLSDEVKPQLQPWRLGATLFTAFGVLALLLAAVGIYGVITYDVEQRRRELGVRVALGARARSLVRLVMNDAVTVVAAGLVAGLITAAIVTRFMEPLLYNVPSRDPAVLLSASVLLLAVACGAAGLPAWRAAGAQPTDALRED
jgi:putative ABC transport system permease protein